MALRRLCIAVLLVAAASATARAQEDEQVQFDRPGFTPVTRPAPMGRLVTEGGVLVEIDDDRKALALPELLTRFGVLFPWLELRARIPSAVFIWPDRGDNDFEWGDLQLGAGLGGPIAPELEASLVPVVVVPLEEGDWGSDGVDGWAQGTLAWKPTPSLNLELSSLIGWVQEDVQPEEDDDDTLSARLRVLVGALVGVRPVRPLLFFVQGWAEHVETHDVEGVVGGGAAWRIRPDFQVDTWVDVGIGGEAPDVQVNAGASVFW